MDDTQKIVEAIHKLEVAMVKELGEQKTTLQRHTDAIEHLIVTDKAHQDVLFGEPNDLSLPSRVHNLEEIEKTRRWTLRAIVTGFLAMLGNILWDLIR